MARPATTAGTTPTTAAWGTRIEALAPGHLDTWIPGHGKLEQLRDRFDRQSDRGVGKHRLDQTDEVEIKPGNNQGKFPMIGKMF